MKVLAIVTDISSNKLGGAEMHFVEVLKVIAPKLSGSTILVGPEDSLKEDFKKYPDIDFVTVSYPHVPNFFGIFYILFATPKAIWLTWKNNYDLIWAKQEYPQAQVGALVKMVTGKPLYITTQNPILHKEEFVVKGEFLRPFRKYLEDLVTVLIEFALRKANLVAAVSQYSADLSKKTGVKNVVVIPNGVDTSVFTPVSKKRGKTHFELVSTSSLIPRNGVDTIIEACASLPKDFKWILTIAGDGPMRDDIEKLIRELKISNKVNVLGRVQNSKIPDLVRNSDVFIRPSRAEGFGISFVEAMASGVPVIGTPVGGIVDFLKDKETGISVPVDNPDKLADAIILLFKDKKLRNHIIDQALILIKQRYQWKIIGKSVYANFQKLV